MGVLLAACETTGAASNRMVVVDGKQVHVDEAAQPLYQAAIDKKDAGEMEAASAQLKVLLDKYPDSRWAALATISQAEVLLALDRPQQAQALLEKLLLEDPASAVADDARYTLALAQLAQGQTKAATGALEKNLERLDSPEEKKAATAELAETLKESGQPSAAAKYESQALDLTDDPAERKTREAGLMRLVDEEMPFNEVRRMAETEAKPGTFLDEIVLFKLARIHLHLRDDDRAAERLTQYLERYPEGRFAERALALDAALKKRATVDAQTIGIVLPLTGVYKSYGQRVLTAILLGAGSNVDPAAYKDDKTGEGTYERAMEGGAKVKLVVRDSAGSPQVAQDQVRILVEDDHAIAIIGDILLDTSLPVALRAEEMGIPVISLSRRDGLATLGPNTFRVSFTAQKQARALAILAMEKMGHKKFGVLYPRHSYGVNLMNAFWDEVEKRQGEVTAIESYAHDQTTFTPEARAMVGRAHLEARYEFNVCKNKAKELEDPYRKKKAMEKCAADVSPIVDFDALLIPDDYRTVSYILPAFEAEDVLMTSDRYTIAVFKKTTKNRRARPVQLLGGNMWNNPELGKRLGRKIDGAIFVDGFYAGSDVPAVRKFVKAFAKVHRSRPGLLDAQGHDASALLTVLVTGGAGKALTSRTALRQALAKTKDFPGVTGMVTFDEKGDSATTPVFFTFQRGRLEVAEDEQLKGKGEG